MNEIQAVGTVIAALGLLFVVYVRHRRELSLSFAFVSVLFIVLFEYSMFNYGFLSSVFLGRFSPLVSILVASVIVLFFAVLLVNAKAVRNSAQLRNLIRQQAVDDFEPSPRRQASPNATPLVAVVVPAKNEAASLGGVLEKLNLSSEYQLIPVVVDDGSSDDTIDVAREFNAVAVRHHMTVGYGGALKTGYAIAKKLGAEIVVQIDADGENDPAEMGRLITEVVRDSGRLVIGSRFLGGTFKTSRARRAGMGFFTWLTNVLTGFELTDVTSGYRAFSLARVNSIEFDSDMHCAIEMILRAKKNGMSVKEVPVAYQARVSGQSKLFSARRMLRFPFVMFGQILSFYL